MNELTSREYAALRDTIRSRGGTRPLAFLAGLSVWTAVLVGILIWLPTPLAAAVPLLVLLGTFEVVRSLHLGVERIGRYIQVFFEEKVAGEVIAPPAWETTAMLFGPSIPGAGVHPLFLPVFILATLINYFAVLFPGPVIVELGTMAVPHLAFIGRMHYCDRGMRRQRADELARYRALKDSRTPVS